MVTHLANPKSTAKPKPTVKNALNLPGGRRLANGVCAQPVVVWVRKHGHVLVSVRIHVVAHALVHRLKQDLVENPLKQHVIQTGMIGVLVHHPVLLVHKQEHAVVLGPTHVTSHVLALLLKQDLVGDQLNQPVGLPMEIGLLAHRHAILEPKQKHANASFRIHVTPHVLAQLLSQDLVDKKLNAMGDYQHGNHGVPAQKLVVLEPKKGHVVVLQRILVAPHVKAL